MLLNNVSGVLMRNSDVKTRDYKSWNISLFPDYLFHLNKQISEFFFISIFFV